MQNSRLKKDIFIKTPSVENFTPREGSKTRNSVHKSQPSNFTKKQQDYKEAQEAHKLCKNGSAKNLGMNKTSSQIVGQRTRKNID
jgi:hypothetical protein